MRPPDTVDPSTINPSSLFGKVRNEKAFTSQVIHEADLSGWTSYHTYNSQRSQPGFPDLVMVRGSRLIFAELKMGQNTKLTTDQEIWLGALRSVPHVETYLWRYPNDVDEVLRVLK